MKRYIVRAVSEIDDEDVKFYGITTSSARRATDLVGDYIEEHGHFQSINYGYDLTCLPAEKAAGKWPAPYFEIHHH